jgi:NAD-reducing hydrogenase small subunit
VLQRAYIDAATIQGQLPQAEGIVPPLLDTVRPVHQVVPVDVFLPGCPPHPDVIYGALVDLLDGRTPDLAGRTRFG